jgi:hypothetical protein
MLNRHRRRTGVDLKRLLAGRVDAPDGLNIEEIERFCSGEAKRLPRAHFEYLINAWSKLPKAGRQSRVRRERIDLTPDLRAELRGHWLRVGLSVPAFFGSLDNPPPDLTAGKLWRWIDDRHPRRVRKDDLEFVPRRMAETAGRHGAPEADSFHSVGQRGSRTLSELAAIEERRAGSSRRSY